MRLAVVGSALAALVSAVGVHGLLLPAASTAKPVVYRGDSRGVTVVLAASSVGGSVLTVSFGRRAEAIRQRALHTPGVEVFCIWPPHLQTSYFAQTVPLDPRRRALHVELSLRPRGAGYICGLHTPSSSPRGVDGTYDAFIRHAIVSARLTRTPG